MVCAVNQFVDVKVILLSDTVPSETSLELILIVIFSLGLASNTTVKESESPLSSVLKPEFGLIVTPC